MPRKDRGRVSLRKHELIIGQIVWVRWIVSHDREKQNSHNLSCRRATRWVTAASRSRRTNGIDSKPRTPSLC
jgi:hypothetical protein